LFEQIGSGKRASYCFLKNAIVQPVDRSVGFSDTFGK